MTRRREKLLLQGAVAIASLVPITIGAAGVIEGVAILKGASDAGAPDIDSHFRYLSGIFLVLGLAFASCVSAIENKTPLFRLLGAMVITGGLARGLSWVAVGAPSLGHRLGLVMELGVVPLLMLWQARVARRCLPPA
ncbi:MAG: DUF4345 domain-containing protein [Sphingomonadaceae bacterium]|nr:DUF4345 domain-containing protein [Sphingomonadaceae bacterium]